MIQSVKRVTTIDPTTFLQEHAVPGVPLIVTGYVPSWPDFSRWSLPFLLERCGAATLVPVATSDNVRGEMALEDFESYIDSPAYETRPIYLRDWEFARTCPQLRSSLGALPWLTPNWLKATNDIYSMEWLYVGAPPSRSTYHQDVLATHAWMAMLAGTKEWELVEAWPKREGQARPHRYHCELHAGEALFVPSNIWHRVHNKTLTIGFSVNYVDHTNFADAWNDCAASQRKPLAQCWHSHAIDTRLRFPDAQPTLNNIAAIVRAWEEQS